ncbi:MAG: hypothetical protein AAFS10_09790, partial [Myxococcota bacterium]
ASGPWIAVEPNACATYGPMHHKDAPSLYTVYHNAFSTRPGTCLEEHRWISKWPHHALCVPSLSVVAVVAEEHVGYLLSYIDDERPGEATLDNLG